jgi:4-alpha-glucanotransferase
MTTTHDLPTVLGWWRGRDIDWRERLELFPDAAVAEAERARRAADRPALWSAMHDSGAAEGEAPTRDEEVVDAAAAHVGGAGCALALLPLEDALALAEQPNLPGTIDQHPNWRRRLTAEVTTLMQEPAVQRRLEAFARARRAAAGEAG